MDLNQAMFISSMGMRAQGERMKIIAQNVANASTAANTPDGDPYQRQILTFKTRFDKEMGTEFVDLAKIERDDADFPTRLDPNHPGADENGYVRMPNVNSLIEMTDMREAQRSYEANLGMIEMSRSMLFKTIDLLRS